MIERKPLFGANWKAGKSGDSPIYITHQFVRNFFVDNANDRGAPFNKAIKNEGKAEVIIIPPFTSISDVVKESQIIMSSKSDISIGAQDVYPEKSGAYTGAVTPPMLANAHVKYVLTGHSERRHIFGDNNATVGDKGKAVYLSNMTPILCVGETLQQRQASNHFSTVRRQLRGAFNQYGTSVSDANMEELVIAYEPVWAIGTGEVATPDEAQTMHKYIRNYVRQTFDDDIACQIRIIYGGSVKPANVKELMAQPDIDGALVGGASLDPKSFVSIVQLGTNAFYEKDIAYRCLPGKSKIDGQMD